MSTTSGSYEGIFGTNDAVNNAIARRRRRLTSNTLNSVLESIDFKSPVIFSDENSNSTFDPLTALYRSVVDREKLSRRLQSNSSTPTLTNPVVCIKLGDSIIFDISNDNYPVYDKDSLLNTNPNFDYSEFRNLEFLAPTSVTLSSFVFTFTESGNYQFSMSKSRTTITIISVMEANVQCSTDAQFGEFNQANLIKLGVTANDNIVLSPDWNLVIGLVLGMFALVNLVVGFLYYFRKKAWAGQKQIDAQYRKDTKKLADPKGTKGGIFSKNNKVAVTTDGAEGKLFIHPLWASHI
jgi:hypothetical protein